jgi:hypothetical protein
MHAVQNSEIATDPSFRLHALNTQFQMGKVKKIAMLKNEELKWGVGSPLCSPAPSNLNYNNYKYTSPDADVRSHFSSLLSVFLWRPSIPTPSIISIEWDFATQLCTFEK